MFHSIAGPVIKKILESIALHITNKTDAIPGLPAFCYEAGLWTLTPYDFARAVTEINLLSKHDVYISLNACFQDLLAWLLCHWPGRITIAIEDEIVFEEIIGLAKNILICSIKYDTSPAISICCGVSSISIKKLSKNGTILFTGKDYCYSGYRNADGDTVPRYRHKLYHTHNSSSRDFRHLTDEELRLARRAARGIVKSIMDLRVVPSGTVLEIKHTDGRSFYEYAVRVPGLLQEEEGKFPPSEPQILIKEVRDVEYTIQNLHLCYPEISNVLQRVKQRCAHGCQRIGSDAMDGCLQMKALIEIVLLVAHAMVDAAGGLDVSNLYGEDSVRCLIKTCTILLFDIASLQPIPWRTWFKLAASGVTGLPVRRHEVGTRAWRVKTPICWSAGTTSVVPLWLQLDQPVKLEHSWGIKVLRGSLSQDFADIARVESAFTAEAHSRDFPPLMPLLGLNHEDKTPIEILNTITTNPAENSCLFTFVKTQQTLRIIDPCDVYFNALRAKNVTCRQHCESKQVDAYLYGLDDVLWSWSNPWSNSWSADLRAAHIAKSGSQLHQNLVLGLAGLECLIQGPDCCMVCFVETVTGSHARGIYHSNMKSKYLTS